MDSDWCETVNGNWVLVGSDGIEATVYAAGPDWGAVWNGAADGKPRRLKKKFETSDRAISAVETAIAEGKDSMRWWPPDEEWQSTRKKDGWYRKHKGLVCSVKKAKSGSWYATNSAGALLGQGSRATWFATDGDARAAVDALTRGSSAWAWVGREA
jgi:hypothetical protein